MSKQAAVIAAAGERPKPAQLFWELRFGNMRAVNVKYTDVEDLEPSFELDNIPKCKRIFFLLSRFLLNSSTRVLKTHFIFPN